MTFLYSAHPQLAAGTFTRFLLRARDALSCRSCINALVLAHESNTFSISSCPNDLLEREQEEAEAEELKVVLKLKEEEKEWSTL